MEISASVLSAKKESAIRTFYDLEVANVNYFHIDVMDGEFVENENIDLMKDYTTTIKNISQILLDVHLMVKDVEYFVDEYIDFNPRFITFHLETINDKKTIENNIEFIRKNGSMVGIAINPETDVNEILPYLNKIDLVLVMSVVPGQGGQEFLENVAIDKISFLRKYINDNNLNTLIEVDGGINSENVKKIKDAGADIIVVGTYLINSEDYIETCNKLRDL